jgi:thiol-disulfide isomerase/thioredoxin
MTRCRIMVAVSLLVVSAIGAPAEPAAEPEVKLGEFIPATTPQPAPEMSFAGLDGKPVALADFKGRFLILNLWATWCQPCLMEMPSLEKLQASLAPALAVLAVSEDHGGAEIVGPFIAKLGLDDLKIGLDPQSNATHTLHARGLPTSLVIDRDGQVLGRVEGGADWNSDELRAVLTKLMPITAPKS